MEGRMKMNGGNLTASVTAIANIIAAQLEDDEIALVASLLVQLGDTLATIAAVRAVEHTENAG